MLNFCELKPIFKMPSFAKIYHPFSFLLIVVVCSAIELGKANTFHLFSETHRSVIRPARMKRQTTRILNGQPVTPHEFPQLARIYFYYPGRGPSRCTGSIVTKDWILTAAFCVAVNSGYVPDLSTLRVIVGHHNESVRERSEQNLSVVDVIVNQHYA